MHFVTSIFFLKLKIKSLCSEESERIELGGSNE
jgi:hypothetical protein